MAYRFNPPPNWPIDDPAWAPPPGWQPDPSWGPAPEGWNFWIDAETPAESQAPVSTDDEMTDEDATRVVASRQLPSVEGADTAEYPGPDLEADLAQQASYEAVPSAEPSAQRPSQVQSLAADIAPKTPAQGTPAPGADSTSGWTASTGRPAATPPQGLIARFWWIGCIVLFLGAVLLAALVVAIVLLSGGLDGAGAAGPDPADLGVWGVPA